MGSEYKSQDESDDRTATHDDGQDIEHRGIECGIMLSLGRQRLRVFFQGRIYSFVVISRVHALLLLFLEEA